MILLLSYKYHVSLRKKTVQPNKYPNGSHRRIRSTLTAIGTTGARGAFVCSRVMIDRQPTAAVQSLRNKEVGEGGRGGHVPAAPALHKHEAVLPDLLLEILGQRIAAERLNHFLLARDITSRHITSRAEERTEGPSPTATNTRSDTDARPFRGRDETKRVTAAQKQHTRTTLKP